MSVEHLLVAGYDVAFSARSKDQLTSVANELKSMFSEQGIIAIPCDFAKAEQINDLVAKVKAKWNEVDVIVNNVGVYRMGAITELHEGHMEAMMNVNFFSAYRHTIPFVSGMIEKRLKLRKPIYSESAAYGHMGRKPEKVTKVMESGDGKTKKMEVELFTWEKLDMVNKVKKEFGI